MRQGAFGSAEIEAWMAGPGPGHDGMILSVIYNVTVVFQSKFR